MYFFKNFLQKILLLIAIYFLSRFCFLINNYSSFNFFDEVSFFSILIECIRFDLSILLYINSLVLFLILIPINLRVKKWYRTLVNTIFLIVNIPFIILNNIDIEFFKFNQKRITSDFVDLLLLGNDTIQILPSYLLNYWPLLLVSALQILLLIKYNKFQPQLTITNLKAFNKSALVFLVSVLFFVFGARGGLQLKPINTINAGELSDPKFSNLILNTPFTFLHSFKDERLVSFNYFNDDDLVANYSTYRQYSNDEFKKNNVVIIIMESLSKEFVGFYNNHNLTPFLDSLAKHSLIFNNAFSNGLRSIEALPAITASIPTLSNTPFISSVYAQNTFNALPYLLKKNGYSTSFFHGGTRGTMGFYGFAKKAGFQNYYGLEEYGNMDDYDGTWGIYDHSFLEYFSKKLSEKKEPFFSTFFSLSAHPPYNIPEKFKTTFKDGDLEIHKLISYSDYSLKLFFESIKNEDWFNNTLFVITSDHTSPKSSDNLYKNKIGRYSIPMLFYTPNKSLNGQSDVFTQHIDIMPSILDYLNYQEPFFAFGESVFKKNSWAVHHINNRYCLITENGIINNRQERYSTFSDWNFKNKIDMFESDINFIKAFKQSYSKKMKNNDLIIK